MLFYQKDEVYKAKIDALTDALLSKAVSDYVNEKWGGAITCDSSSQIDLRQFMKVLSFAYMFTYNVNKCIMMV